ncbi:MAG: ABC transporter substrate-binding protein [Alphaproteobacteria bacterium]|nr:ABC transporter substrate-binding protein [Alphaproteobacteria bacterium]
MLHARFLAAAMLALAATAAMAQTEPPKPAQIVINDSGGAMQNAMRKAFYDEFEKRYGIKVVATSPVDLGKLQAMVKSGNVEWAVTEIGGQDAILAEESGLLEPLDLKVIDLSRYPEHLRTRKFVFPKGVYSTVMGYRTDVFKEGQRPQSWADFWNVQKFPGPRTLQNAPVDNLEFALIADGVPKDKLYPLDLDRAFKKLDQIKKHVTVWWTTGAQSAQVLIDKEAVLGTAWNGRYYVLIEQKAPIAIEWNQGALKESSFGIPKGSKDAYWGQRFLGVVAEAKPQGVYANIIGYPGLNLDATKYTDEKLIPFLPTSPENFPKQFWTDLAWWKTNGPAVQERWARWMLQ